MQARKRAALVALACVAGLTASASSAWAEGTHAGSDRMNIEVAGTVSQRCGIGQVSDMDLGDLSRPGLAVSADLPLICNVPFDLRISSENGALAHERNPAGQGGYAGRVLYRATLNMPVLNPARRVITQSFTSAQLQGGQVISSGDGVALEGARLAIELAPVTGAGLLAGAYADTVALTISPRP